MLMRCAYPVDTLLSSPIYSRFDCHTLLHTTTTMIRFYPTPHHVVDMIKQATLENKTNNNSNNTIPFNSNMTPFNNFNNNSNSNSSNNSNSNNRGGIIRVGNNGLEKKITFTTDIKNDNSNNSSNSNNSNNNNVTIIYYKIPSFVLR